MRPFSADGATKNRRNVRKGFKVLKITFIKFLLVVITILAWRIPAQDSLAELDLENMGLEELLSIEVFTASRSSESAAKAPGTLVVVTRDQIRQRGYTNLMHVLEDLPGIDVQNRSDGVLYNRVTIRGVFGNNKFVILQNGIRISSPTGEPLPIYENFPIYYAKQIEIVYGPASALYGADAFTGVINIITDDLNGQPGGDVRVDVGEDGYLRSEIYGRVNFSDNAHMLYGGHFHEYDGPDLASEYPDRYQLGDLVDFGGNTVFEAAQREGASFPEESRSFFLNMSLGEHFKLGYTGTEEEHTTALAVRPNFVDYGGKPYWTNQMDTLYATYDYDFSDSFSTSIQASYSRYEVDPDTKFTNIFVGYLPGYKYSRGTEFELSQQFNTSLGQNTSLIFGYTAEWFDSIPLTADLPAPYNPDLPGAAQNLFFPGTNGELPIPVFEINYRNVAAYAQVRHNFGETLAATVGLRYDDSTTYGDTTNPRLGLVWTPVEKTVVKLLFGEAFLAPAPVDQFRFFGSFAFQREDGLYQSFFFQVPNSGLTPEEMQTIELNFSRQLSSNLSMTAVIFQAEVDQLIQPQITSQPVADFIPGGSIATTQTNLNSGSLEVFGGELSLIYRRNLDDGRKLNLWFNASGDDGDFETGGATNGLPFTTDFKVKMGGTYSTERWFITPQIHFIGETTLSEVGNFVGETVDSYTRIDLFGGFNINQSFSLHAEIDNLLDEDYGSPGVGAASVFNSVPQPGTVYRGGLRWRF